MSNNKPITKFEKAAIIGIFFALLSMTIHALIKWSFNINIVMQWIFAGFLFGLVYYFAERD